jgi:hypothetical protein
MKTPLALLLVVSLGLTLVGCNKNDASSSGATSTATPTATPARQTSFAEVTSQLDPGGNVYAYLATDQWLAGLSTNITRLKGFILSLPDVAEPEHEKINQVFDLLAGGVAKSGLENLTGVGLSGVQISPELHRTKLILHHKKGQGDGLFWNIMGKQPHALTGLDFLTTNTAVAAFGDVDIAALWEAIESGLTKSGVPELRDGIKKWPAEFEKQTKLSWAKLLDSFGGEMGLVLTLDHEKMIGLPLGGEGLEIPTPGLLFAIKVNDDLLYQRISSELKKSQMVELTEGEGLQMCAMPIPVPLPVELQITVAHSGDYFFVATSPTMVRNALAVRAGKQPGLRQTPEFAALLKQLPAQGNQFMYADKRFSSTFLEVQKKVLASQNKLKPEQLDLIQKLFLSQGPTFGLSIGAHTATGWQSVSVGNQDSSASLVAAPVVGVTAVGAAMLLPALAKAKAKAQSISCVNNMKQLGLAFRIWAGDNNDLFPFNVSNDKGGTLELCERGGDGYDRSAYRHFQVMSNELNTPKILICPADSSKQPASNFAELQSWNVSYQVRTGPKVSDVNPEEILTYCPIHHHVGRTDGSVQMGTQSKR